MFTTNKTLNRTINNNTTYKAADTIFTLINEELKRLHGQHDYYMKSGNFSKEAAQNNLSIVDRQINSFHKLIIEVAEKGMTEDVQNQLKDLQNTVGETLLLGGGK